MSIINDDYENDLIPTGHMKAAFMFNDRDNANAMMNYLKDEGIYADEDSYLGYQVVYVDPSQYEEALQKGKFFAVDVDMFGYWLDKYNDRFSPLGSSAVAFGALTQLPFEEGFSLNGGVYLSEEIKHTAVRNYLNAMKEYLEVEKVFVRLYAYDAGCLIMPLDPDYEKMREGVADFIKENGYGPFSEIIPISITGEYIEEPFPIESENNVKGTR